MTMAHDCHARHACTWNECYTVIFESISTIELVCWHRSSNTTCPKFISRVFVKLLITLALLLNAIDIQAISYIAHSKFTIQIGRFGVVMCMMITGTRNYSAHTVLQDLLESDMLAIARMLQPLERNISQRLKKVIFGGMEFPLP